MQVDEAKSAELVARLETLPFSKWHRNFFILGFIGVMFDAGRLRDVRRRPAADCAGVWLGARAGRIVRHGRPDRRICRRAVLGHDLRLYRPPHRIFQATVGIFALFTGLVAASWNVASLGAFRFLSNFGLGGEVPVTLTLTAEFSPGRIRGA